MREPTRDKRGGAARSALVDDWVKADIRDERPRISEAGERTEFAEQGGGGLRADARDGLQQLAVGGPSAWLAGGQQRRRGAVDLVNRAGETLQLAHQRAHDVRARGRRLATVQRASSAVADARGVGQRESAG